MTDPERLSFSLLAQWRHFHISNKHNLYIWGHVAPRTIIKSSKQAKQVLFGSSLRSVAAATGRTFTGFIYTEGQVDEQRKPFRAH